MIVDRVLLQNKQERGVSPVSPSSLLKSQLQGRRVEFVEGSFSLEVSIFADFISFFISEASHRQKLKEEEARSLGLCLDEVKEPVDVLVGNFEVSRELRQIFKNHFSRFKLSSSQKGAVSWLRDLSVATPFGKSFRPAPWEKTREKKERIRAILESLKMSYHASSFALGNGLSIDAGGLQEGLVCAMTKSRSNFLSLEGGNVRFWRFGDRWGAFVGMASVVMSLQNMEEKGEFLQLQDAVRRKQVMDLLPQPLYVKLRFLNQEELYCKWLLTLLKMGEELGLDPRNICVLEHGSTYQDTDLHIDLSVLVGPDRTVFIEDSAKTYKVIKGFMNQILSEQPQFSSEAMAYKKLLQQIGSKKNISQQILRRSRQIFENLGLRVVSVPGRIRSSLEVDIGGQFLNGLLMKQEDRYMLVSPAVSYSLSPSQCRIANCVLNIGIRQLLQNARHDAVRLAEPFFDQMRDQGVDVVFCDITQNEGGAIHCMTEEVSLAGPRITPQLIHAKSLPNTVLTQVQICEKAIGFIAQKCSSVDMPLTLHFLNEKSESFLIQEMGSPKENKGLIWKEVRIPWPVGQKGSVQVKCGDICLSRPHLMLPGHPQLIEIE